MELQDSGMYIDGQLIQGDGPGLDVENPSNETVVGTIASATTAQVVSAIGAARAAYDRGSWSALPATERVARVAALLDWFDAHRDLLRHTVMLEAGCPIGAPIMYAQVELPLRQTRDLLPYYLQLPDVETNPVPLMQRINAAGQFVDSLKRHVPVGVVSAISAYNFPFLLNLWKVVPALITGNTVVLRPSPLTPYSALLFGQAAQAAGLPPGVLNVVVDAGHEGGVLLTTDPRVDMVTFTGSSGVGERVAAQAAHGIKRIQLELGGKSAQIYLPDAMGKVAGAAASVCLSHAGQGCALGTRVFVPAAEKAHAMEQMAAALRGVVIGDAADPATQMGPVISAAQRDRCESFVQAARDEGAKVVCGGRRPAGLPRGYYFEPTVLDVPDNRNPAAQEEIFGPVVCVIGYDSVEHAVAMANDSRYGLSGYVYGQDMHQALTVAQSLRTGTVNVNSGLMSAFASSGGFGASGIGRERGLEGLRVYQQLQVLSIAN
jgi:aldehyde dehydrogenase (NAD+)